MGFIVHLLVTAVIVMIAAYILPGVRVKSFVTALIVALLLAIANATLGALLNLVTFGILSFFVTVIMIMLVDKLVSGFEIDNFWWAVAFALVIAVINYLLGYLMPGLAH